MDDRVAGTKRKNGIDAEHLDNSTSAPAQKHEKSVGAQKCVVGEEDMCRFVIQCIECALRIHSESKNAAAIDTHKQESESTSGAHQLAALLIDADKRSHFSHGINRLDNYLNELENGVSIGAPNGVEPIVVKKKGGTALVDGRNCLGAVVGNFCSRLAVEIARDHGIAWIVARNSNHFGICAHYAISIANAGFIGMSFTNTSPCAFLKGAAEKSAGSNPICVVANAANDQFALDMATTNVAYGKVEVAKAEGHDEIPVHWTADRHGHTTTSAHAVLQEDGGLLPLGALAGFQPPAVTRNNGSTDSSNEASILEKKSRAKSDEEKSAHDDCSYKGSGLIMMVELFTSILGGATFGKSVRKWRNFGRDADLGQCFVALDPNCFEDGFADRFQKYIEEVRGLKRTNVEVPVLIPGDPEKQHASKCATAGGLIYEQVLLDKLKGISEKYKVEMVSFRPYYN